jgi:hypothetical protein
MPLGRAGELDYQFSQAAKTGTTPPQYGDEHVHRCVRVPPWARFEYSAKTRWASSIASSLEPIHDPTQRNSAQQKISIMAGEDSLYKSEPTAKSCRCQTADNSINVELS